jgi:hypothetical protein
VPEAFASNFVLIGGAAALYTAVVGPVIAWAARSLSGISSYVAPLAAALGIYTLLHAVADTVGMFLRLQGESVHDGLRLTVTTALVAVAYLAAPLVAIALARAGFWPGRSTLLLAAVVLFAVLTLPFTIRLHDCYGGLVFVIPTC